jgi:hypothetical protein
MHGAARKSRRRRVQVGFSHRRRKHETMKLDPLWLMTLLLWTVAVAGPLAFLIFAH